MSTWEERMAERAAVRRMLREAEAHANDGDAPTVGGCGFEWGTTTSGPRPWPSEPPPEQPEGIPWS